MHIEMDPDIRPVHAPRRRIPVAKVLRVNEALEKLCEERVKFQSHNQRTGYRTC